MSLLDGGGTLHPNPAVGEMSHLEATTRLEELRLAAVDVLTVLAAAGMLPASAEEPLARLRAAVEATPAATILVPFGEPCPDGSIVHLGGR